MHAMTKMFLMLSGLNGFLAVALGAFAAHGLRARLTPDLLNTFQTGVQYHMYHSLALLAVAILCSQYSVATSLRVSGLAFIIGIILFSGSLYALSLFGIRWLGVITPLGGLAFLVGWAALCWFALGLATASE